MREVECTVQTAGTSVTFEQAMVAEVAHMRALRESQKAISTFQAAGENYIALRDARAITERLDSVPS